MAPQVFTIESNDKGVQLLQLAKVLPTTVVLDDEDFPDGVDKKYKKFLEEAETDTSVPEVGPERVEEKKKSAASA